MSGKRVVAAMSGGVDSLVAAALLKGAGHQISGIYLKLWAGPGQEENIAALGYACRRLEIPLQILSL